MSRLTFFVVQLNGIECSTSTHAKKTRNVSELKTTCEFSDLQQTKIRLGPKPIVNTEPNFSAHSSRTRCSRGRSSWNALPSNGSPRGYGRSDKVRTALLFVEAVILASFKWEGFSLAAFWVGFSGA